MDFLSPVKAQNDIAHFSVCELNDIVVNENSVRRKREAEILVFFLFDASRIADKLFDDVKVHQRFTAEKVDFEIFARSRILNEKIKRPFPDLEAHQRAFSVILPLAGKAVRTVQIAGVRYMKTERLDNSRRARFQRSRHRLKRVFREKRPVFFHLAKSTVAFFDVFFRYSVRIFVFFRDAFFYCSEIGCPEH